MKNVGPIRHCEPFYIAIHQVSLLSHAACASISTTTTTTITTTRERGDRYGPIEWANENIVETHFFQLTSTFNNAQRLTQRGLDAVNC